MKNNRNNLKILFITYTHSNGGGAEAVLTTLVNHLPKSWDIDILETLDFSVKKEPINPNINLLSPLTKSYHKIIDRMVRHMFFYHPEVIKALRGLDGYDVVVSWMYRDASFMLPTFPECKRIAWFHGMVDNLLPNCLPGTEEHAVAVKMLKLQKKACTCADRIVEISNKTKESVLRVLPEFSNKLEIIYNGVDIEKIIERSKENIQNANTEKILNKLTATNLPILVSMGSLDSNKNFSLALNALSILKQRGTCAYYLIIGKGLVGELEKLEKLTSSLELRDRVFFMGFQQNPLTLLKSCKVLLVTSFEEGFPTVVTEAMTLGIPFVSTPVAGASEELCKNETCGLVAGWDAKDYADKIEVLLTNEALYKKMSCECKEHVKNFSVDSSLSSFYQMLEKIPQHKAKIRKMSRGWALILFVLYSAQVEVCNYRYNLSILKMRYFVLRKKFNVLNMCKLCYRLIIPFISLARFPFIVIYNMHLAIKYKNRLFGYE